MNRAAVLLSPGHVELEQRPIPDLASTEVLVKVIAVGVCGSDVHYYQHGRIGDAVVTAPIILGHEAAGVVAAVGTDVTKRRTGDRVAIEPGVPCGRCGQCRVGRYNLCPHMIFLATPPIDGAFTEYLAVHEDFAHPLPEFLSYQAGAMMEPLSVAIWACRKAGITGGDRVLVTGAGPIGLLAIQVARALGATEVAVSDINDHRLELAESLGATRTRLEPGGDFGEADTLIECSGAPSALAAGLEALRPAGVAVAVGMGPSDAMELPVALIQRREISLTGTFRYANTYPAAIALADSRRVDLESMITDHFALSETSEALRAGLQNPATVKAIVEPCEGMSSRLT